MKRLLSLLTVLLVIVLLCSCSYSPVPFLPTEQLTGASDSIEANTKNTGDPFVELSVFDDSESDALAFLGEPTDTSIGSKASEFEYEYYSYLGMLGELEFESYASESSESDKKLTGIIFAFYYPGAYNWKPNGPDEVYSPNADDLKTAQQNWDAVVQHYTELYGEPVYQGNEKKIWVKEKRMQYTEFISIEEDYNRKAFVIYCSIEQF